MNAFTEEYARFGAMLTAAEEHFANAELDAAACLAQLAASYAFPANVGLFASPRLERLLVRIGQQIPTDESGPSVERGDKKRYVVHVLSYAKPLGGDSRFAWRWIQQDKSSRHSVIVTSQADVAQTYEIPSELKEAVQSSGGFVHSLRAQRATPMAAARELRAFCRQANTVALHLYPYDIIPVLALATGCDAAKTLYVNHSDHTFWVGSSVAHLIAHLRAQSPEFLDRRRGLKLDSSSLLPIPLDPVGPRMSREQAKRELGIAVDTVLLLTIASPFKYSSPGRVDFLDLVLPVVVEHPQLKLIAVGPPPSGAWGQASINTDGRISPLGRRWDNDLLYAAADVYLDSVPFSSITSLLEAGLHGVPLLGYKPPHTDLGLLGPSAPGLDTAMIVATSQGEYRALLRRLIINAQFRRQAGERVRQDILSRHGAGNWLKNLEGVYSMLEKTKSRGCLADRDDRFEPGTLNLALVQLFKQVQGRLHVRQLISQHIGSLPYASRFAITWRLYHSGFDLVYLNLLPPPLDAFVRRIGRRVRSAFLRLAPR